MRCGYRSCQRQADPQSLYSSSSRLGSVSFVFAWDESAGGIGCGSLLLLCDIIPFKVLKVDEEEVGVKGIIGSLH